MSPTINPLDRIMESGVLGALVVIEMIVIAFLYRENKARVNEINIEKESHLSDVKVYLVDMQSYADMAKIQVDNLPAIRLVLDTIVNYVKDLKK